MDTCGIVQCKIYGCSLHPIQILPLARFVESSFYGAGDEILPRPTWSLSVGSGRG